MWFRRLLHRASAISLQSSWSPVKCAVGRIMRYDLTDNGWPAIKLMLQSVRY
jgi:hypothetical protein